MNYVFNIADTAICVTFPHEIAHSDNLSEFVDENLAGLQNSAHFFEFICIDDDDSQAIFDYCSKNTIYSKDSISVHKYSADAHFLPAVIENNYPPMGELLRIYYIPENNLPCVFQYSYQDNRYICLYPKSKSHFFNCTNNLLKTIGIEQPLLAQNKLMLHCSYIIKDGYAILFSAPCGVGKSTQAYLWSKFENAAIINGDRAAIGIVDNILLAYGLPIAGSSDIFKNVAAPVKAIVLLSQSDSNYVEKLSALEAYKALLGEITTNSFDKNFVERQTQLLINILQMPPVVRLHCTPDKEAINTLKQYLNSINNS